MRKKNRATQHLSGCIGSQEVCDKPEGIFSIQSAVPFPHTYRLFYKTVISITHTLQPHETNFNF